MADNALNNLESKLEELDERIPCASRNEWTHAAEFDKRVAAIKCVRQLIMSNQTHILRLLARSGGVFTLTLRLCYDLAFHSSLGILSAYGVRRHADRFCNILMNCAAEDDSNIDCRWRLHDRSHVYVWRDDFLEVFISLKAFFDFRWTLRLLRIETGSTIAQLAMMAWDIDMTDELYNMCLQPSGRRLGRWLITGLLDTVRPLDWDSRLPAIMQRIEYLDARV